MKITVKRYRGVANWKWNVDDDVCGICRVPGDDCPPVWGQCNHAFHMHCIVKWVESQQNVRQQCPMCRADWTFRA